MQSILRRHAPCRDCLKRSVRARKPRGSALPCPRRTIHSDPECRLDRRGCNRGRPRDDSTRARDREPLQLLRGFETKEKRTRTVVASALMRARFSEGRRAPALSNARRVDSLDALAVFPAEKPPTEWFATRVARSRKGSQGPGSFQITCGHGRLS